MPDTKAQMALLNEISLHLHAARTAADALAARVDLSDDLKIALLELDDHLGKDGIDCDDPVAECSSGTVCGIYEAIKACES